MSKLGKMSRWLAAIGLMGAVAAAHGQVILYDGSNSPSENFDTLANTATAPASSLPNGWYLSESSSDTNYTADNGSLNSGTTYSYGSTGSTERALGTLASNSTVPTIGARLQNASAGTLAQILITYRGEQWRLGASGVSDQLDFQYSLDATSLTTGTWTDVNALDFVSPVTTGTVGALDGNASGNRTSVTATISGLNWAAGGSLWIRWLDPNISGADHGLAIDDIVFGTPVDNPPSVVTTVPASAATNVPVNTNIVINFSEPVQTVNPWLNLTCSSLNLSAGTITSSNGGATWTLDPTDNPDPNSNCTVTITAANVTDLDGTANAMTANYQFSFQTAPDNAPTVMSTFPGNNAVNVPIGSSVTVTFSEPVTATGSAFTLTCQSVMGAISFATSNAGFVTYTLDPTSNLPVNDNCTLTIDGTQITDQDGAPNQMMGESRINFQTGVGLSDYYSRVDTSSCRALRPTLHGVIDDHNAVVYSDSDNTFTPGDPSTYDVYEIINEGDEDPLNPNNVLDIYKNVSYPKQASGANGYNREHTWPNSHGFNDITQLDGFPNAPYTDSHMLMVSDVAYNSSRSNRAYGSCNPAVNATCTADVTSAYNGQGGGPNTYPSDDNWKSSVDGGLGRYEVWPYRRGDVARAMLYMDVRYEGGRNSRNFQREPNLILVNATEESSIVATPTGQFQVEGHSGILSELLAWHNQDNVITPQELLRNEVVYNVQGNRNPFVDHPEWAAIIFAEPCTGPELVAVDDDFETTEDTILNRNTANDIGVLNDDKVWVGSLTMTAALVNGSVSHGTATVNSNGQFSYTPPANFCGKAFFDYTSSNGTATDTGRAHIDVACVNDLPTTVGSIPAQNLNVGDNVNLATATFFNDVDGDALNFAISGAPASLSINGSTGVITGSIVSGDIGSYTVTVTASEPSPLTGSVQQQFTLTVGGVSNGIFANSFE